MANLRTAYILWFCGGILGLHHIYLNRPRQCFIWFVTWGGMVIGWLSEVTQLKDYVAEANQTKGYLERVKVMRKHCPKPGMNVTILGSQLMLGFQLGKLLMAAVPEYYILEPWYAPYLAHLLSALGAAIGVYVASNVGSQQAPFLLPFLAAASTVPTAFFLYNQRNIYTVLCVAAASFVSGYYSKWTTERKRSDLIGYLKMCAILSLALTTYGALWTSNVYNNTIVHTLNGTRIPLRDAVSNFMKTQPWDEASDVLTDIFPCMQLYSLDVCRHQILSRLTELSDPERDEWAFNVLGFDKYPTQKQISSHCRKLSSKWHPDRFSKKNDTEKQEAETKFLDIQKACGMMDKAKVNRERRNTWSSSAAEQSETIVTHTDDVYTENSDEYSESDDENTENSDEYSESDDENTEDSDEYAESDDENTENSDEYAESYDENTENSDEYAESYDENTENSDEYAENSDENSDEYTDRSDEYAENSDMYKDKSDEYSGNSDEYAEKKEL